MTVSITISLLALVVSGLALFLSFYQASMNRRLEWEQLRGSVQVRLTSRGVELLVMIEQLPCVPGDEVCDLKTKLIRITDGLVDVRRRLVNISPPLPLLFRPSLTIGFTKIKCDLDDAEPVFDALDAAMREVDFPKANRIADGLLERLYGARNKNA